MQDILGKKIIVLLVLFFAVLPAVVFAHQPRLVSAEKTILKNPEISQAFYGELKGSPQWFEINSDRDFLLYVNMLQPTGAPTQTTPPNPGLSAEILPDRGEGNSELIAALEGANFQWTKFHEPFGGDDYWQGPEFKKEVGPGVYLIKVYSPDNLGKYSLAIGEQEKFPPKEILNTILLLPILKKDFFNKSPLSAYFNYTGLFLLGALLILAGIIFAISKIMKWNKKRRGKDAPMS